MEYQTEFERNPPHIEDVILKFREDFERIKKMGWMKSHRSHNTGIGKTFEDIIGVNENNSQLADYMDALELKSQRDFTGSMITLFTKSPDNPILANSYIREKYGVSSNDDPRMKILHTTVSGSNFNSYKGNLGFKLEINEKEERIYVLVKNLNTNEILDRSIYYFFETLQPLIEHKCRNIAYVEAETKNEGEREYFRYTKATLLTNLTFRKFLDAINGGLILYDIRIGVYKTGKSIGKTHDHGSGFRIKKADIGNVFEIVEIT